MMMIVLEKKLSLFQFTLNPSAMAKPAPCNINTPHGNVLDK
jgi:hypothetical protein